MLNDWRVTVWGSAIALAMAGSGAAALAQDLAPATPPASESESSAEASDAASPSEAAAQADDSEILAAEAEQLLRQGMTLLEAGEAVAALPLLEQSLARYNLLGDGRGLASAALGIGYAYAELGETARAIAVFESLAEVAATANLPDLTAVTNRALADLRATDSPPTRHSPPTAATNPATAEPVTPDAASAPEFDVAARLARAVELGRQRDFTAALAAFQAVLTRLETTSGDRRLAARALNGIGEVYRHLNQLEQAETYYQQALTIARELDDATIAGIALHNLGSARMDAATPAAAIDYYQQAIARFREAERPVLVQQTWVNLSTAYRRLEQNDAAVAALESALVIAQDGGDRTVELALLQALVELHQALGQSEPAATYQQQALDLQNAPPQAEAD
ncbi:MAG: tetratricopeptide repeat protein [Spirulinaceae cyanobacterium RM2_2_10]|nr:tetratricopeptide repeat protein [Spirulinaceae cyanobacterium RM2_2_10]